MLGFMPIEWKYLGVGDIVFIPLVFRKKVKVCGPHIVVDPVKRQIINPLGYEFFTERAVVLPFNDERVDLGAYETFLIT